MENLEYIIGLASTALGLLVVLVPIIIGFIKALKAKNIEKVQNALKQFATEAVKEAEKLTDKINGNVKKDYALNYIKGACALQNIEYNDIIASELVEEVVSLTKSVNQRDKDKKGETK